MREQIQPKKTPIKVDPMSINAKSTVAMANEVAEWLSPTNLENVWNKTMDTASFRTLSPKTR